MKLMARSCQLLALAVALSGCAHAPPDSRHFDLPLAVNEGIGSEHGNYAAKPDGEMVDANGTRCFLWNWDRPLTKDWAIRLRSASCESLERPGKMIAKEIGREIIPISESQEFLEETKSHLDARPETP